MTRISTLFVAALALAGFAHAASAQPDPIFCSDFESGDDGSCATAVATLSEGFDDFATLVPAGWLMTNHSSPLGSTDWFQGSTLVFNAQAGAVTSYITANYNNVVQDEAGTISNWLVTPLIEFGLTTSVSFWSRTTSSPANAPDRLQVRVCTGSSCTNVGLGATDVGDFTILLKSINPSLSANGYPAMWTQYTLKAADGVPTSGQGRIAFRYYVTDAGLSGDNADYIGIDTVSVSN